jgi:hypothetical protein
VYTFKKKIQGGKTQRGPLYLPSARPSVLCGRKCSRGEKCNPVPSPRESERPAQETRLPHMQPSITRHVLLLLKCQAKCSDSRCCDFESGRQSEGAGNSWLSLVCLKCKGGSFKGAGIKNNVPFLSSCFTGH